MHKFRREIARKVGRGSTGQDVGNPNVIFLEFIAQTGRNDVNGVLRRPVNPRVISLRGNRGNVDDVTACAAGTHGLYRGLAACQHRYDVGIHHLAPMVAVAFDDRTRVFKTRVIHHDVETAGFLNGLVDKIAKRFVLIDVDTGNLC